MKVSSIQTGQRNYLHKDEHNHDISTIMNYTPQYGYFEIRAKTTSQAGYHCAFWTVGRRDNSTQEAEIDIFEQYGNANRCRFNLIHWDDPNISDNTNDQVLSFNPSAAFHTYGLEWTSSSLKFYIDGVLKRTVNQSPSYGMVFFLSIYENSGWTGTADQTASLYPREFIVDYFRAYTYNGGGYSNIINRNSNKVLEVTSASTSDGAVIQQWTNNGGTNQQWQLVDAGGGYYRLTARHSGKCMRSVNGAVLQYPCDASAWSQQYQMVSQGSYFQLKNRNTGNCLTVTSGSTADGADMQDVACNSTYYRQQFSFAAVTTTKKGEIAINSEEESVTEPVISTFSISPNPVSSVLHFKLPYGFLKGDVKIYDISGKLIYDNILTSEKTEMDVSALKQGLYLMKVTNGGQSWNTKFQKN
jgi:hypothetical protein